jgi:hypothetical protein
MPTRDVKLLRELALQYLELCHQDAQQDAERYGVNTTAYYTHAP